MGFRFQRRLNISRGFGLNISKSGVSPSWRTGFGSISSKGYSVRTGIKGLSYRSSSKSDGSGLIVILLVAFITLLPLLIQLAAVALQLLWFAAKMLWIGVVFVCRVLSSLATWSYQTLGDYIKYRRALANGQEPPQIESNEARLLPDARMDEAAEPNDRSLDRP